MKKLNTVLLLAGLAFLAYLLWRVGPRELWKPVQVLGWGIVPLVLTEGAANWAHTIGWRHCLGRDRTRVPLIRLFRIAMAGFAINYLTPSASLGGEATKAMLVAPAARGPEAVSSVLMDKLCTAFAHLVLAVLGAVFLFWQVKLPAALWMAMAVSTGLLTCGLLGFLLVQKHGKLGELFRRLAAYKIGGRPLQQAAQRVSEVDRTLRAFYCERPLDLLWSVGWHVFGHSVALFQAWMFLRLLCQPSPLAGVLAVGFLGLWLDLVTFAVPLNLGTLEGSRILALKTIGCGAALGMAFGLTVRVAQVFWAVFGLLNYAALMPRGFLPKEGQGVARDLCR